MKQGQLRLITDSILMSWQSCWKNDYCSKMYAPWVNTLLLLSTELQPYTAAKEKAIVTLITWLNSSGYTFSLQ